MKICVYFFLAYISAFLAIAPVFLLFIFTAPILLGAYWAAFVLPIPLAILIFALSMIAGDYYQHWGRSNAIWIGMGLGFCSGLLFGLMNLQSLYKGDTGNLMLAPLLIGLIFAYFGTFSFFTMDMFVRSIGKK